MQFFFFFKGLLLKYCYLLFSDFKPSIFTFWFEAVTHSDFSPVKKLGPTSFNYFLTNAELSAYKA